MRYFWFVIFVLSVGSVSAQNSARVRELEKQRKAALAEIEMTSQLLDETRQTARNSLNRLNLLSKQILSRKQVISLLNQEIGEIDKQIAEEIARAEAEAKAARERAARAERNRLAREKAAASGKKVPETKPEADPVREERVADTKGGYAMTKAEKRLSDDFASNKGRLPYPVSGRHTIVAAFGEQQHQELKYVRTNNSGIDIQTAPGTDARAVFNGEVTRVFVVPGYNNSVIVRHGNYLTVYSNLSQVYVKAGDKVSTRQAIGKIFTDTEDGNATILHFQLWKEKTKLNPAPWLD